MIPDPDLLAQLRDLHPPAAPSWWPLAPGWWIALLLAVALLALAVRHGPPWWRRLRLRRHLLGRLDAIARRHRAGLPAATTAAEVSALLRIAALARFPDRDLAGLHGGEWIAFLDGCDRVPGRFEALQDALTVAPYAPDAHAGAGLDPAPLLRAARGWLRAVL